MDGEAGKYTEVWRHDAYRRVAPGEHHVERFLGLARPGNGASVCDFGCGTGRGAAGIASSAPVSVCAVDFAANCLDESVRSKLGERLRFLQHDLTTPLDLSETFDFGFCTDVMEHIPPADVDLVLTNILNAARRVYFAISTEHDVMGALIGEPLHLTVESPFWWHDTFQRLGARVHWSHYTDHFACFYVSRYLSVDDLLEASRVNVEHEKIKANIRSNISLNLREIVPHAANHDVVYLLAGGPSLNDFEAQIVEAGRSGTPCITMNGTYNWLLSRGIKPAAQVMVDARDFNRRFVEPIVDTCTYLISSQCDHEIVKSLPPDQTWLWHSSSAEPVREAIEELNRSCEWYPVHGGTTVATSSLVLLAMLGFRNVEVFGLDSCIRDDAHHAYEQPENDGDNVQKLKVGSREFRCHPWMVIQANDFQSVVRHILSKIDDFQLVVHGDGMIAEILKYAADAAGSK